MTTQLQLKQKLIYWSDMIYLYMSHFQKRVNSRTICKTGTAETHENLAETIEYRVDWMGRSQVWHHFLTRTKYYTPECLSKCSILIFKWFVIKVIILITLHVLQVLWICNNKYIKQFCNILFSKTLACYYWLKIAQGWVAMAAAHLLWHISFLASK